MTRTARSMTRSRATVRAAAVGVFVVALAAGCGGSAGEDGSGVEQNENGDAATSDGGGAGGSDAGGAGADGSGADGDDQGSGDGASGDERPLPEDADLATEQLPVTAEQAVQIGQDTVGGELLHIEIDHDDDRWEWNLEFAVDGQEHDLEIDATTGEVTERDDDDDSVDDPTVDVTDPLPYAEAMDLALAEVDGRVSGWELDSDDDRIRYQIDIETGDDDTEVDVDVETGEVRVDD